MRNFFQHFIDIVKKKNLLPKVVSLLLAIVLWAYISESKIGVLKFRIPVTYKNLPSNMAVSSISHKYVIASLQGKNEHLKNVQVKNIRAVIDLKSPKIGALKQYPILMVKTEVPENIRVEFNRNYVAAMVEMQVFKDLRVVPRTTGSVDKDYFIGKIEVKPEYIMVEGPQSIVEDMKYINTEDIHLSDARQNIVMDVGLKKDDLKSLDVKEDTVQVVIPVIRYGSLYSLDVPVEARNVPEGYQCQLADREVKVYLKTLENKKLTVSDIEVTLDVSVLNPADILNKKKTATRGLPVKAVLKEGIEDVDIISTVPEEVNVTIFRK